MPQTPPDYGRHILSVVRQSRRENGLDALIDKIAAIRPVDSQGRYLHWDEFRFHAPPEGIDVPTHWAFTRRARAFASQSTPFIDTSGRTFTFTLTDAINRALHEIDSNARGAIGITGAVPGDDEANRFLIRSLVEEPFSSSLLEGAATTRDQAKKLIFENRAPKTQSERMVLNNYHAIEFIKRRRNEDLTPEIVHELHRLVTEGTLDKPNKAGIFRSRNEDVNVVDDPTGEVLHRPPVADELSARLAQLCEFANAGAGDDKFVHPILRAIILHFMLAYDHPYIDGNGRTARALFYWAVLRHGYWLLEYVSISSIINKAPIRYGTAFLHTETDAADLTYFLIHQIDVLMKSIEALYGFIERKRRELDSLSAFLASDEVRREFNHRQIALLHDAVRSPHARYTIQDHLKAHGVSYLTARNDLETLAAAGYLRKRRIGNRSLYVPTQMLRRLKTEVGAGN
jgi:Fic family protein